MPKACIPLVGLELTSVAKKYTYLPATKAGILLRRQRRRLGERKLVAMVR
jgi:hypothetical protein